MTVFYICLYELPKQIIGICQSESRRGNKTRQRESKVLYKRTGVYFGGSRAAKIGKSAGSTSDFPRFLSSTSLGNALGDGASQGSLTTGR